MVIQYARRLLFARLETEKGGNRLSLKYGAGAKIDHSATAPFVNRSRLSPFGSVDPNLIFPVEEYRNPKIAESLEPSN